jgi:hypothetical protein
MFGGKIVYYTSTVALRRQDIMDAFHFFYVKFCFNDQLITLRLVHILQ